jgi:DNA-binding winged helix-turn-helix (wHTH) protein/tetratricopeptide (TPR) repeat protein
MSAAHASAGQGLRFHDLVFDDDLLCAARDDGTTLRLTRQERALIGEFIARPNRLLSRDQLLGALSDDPGEVSDRNVDFLVNRLRRKLKDTARRPRFIATQYGEGYSWIAAPRPVDAPELLLVIGPLRGPPKTAVLSAAERLLDLLQAAFEARTAPGRVRVRPDWRPGEGLFRFSLEIDLRAEAGVLQAALTLRQEPGRRVVSVTRLDAAGAVDEVGAAQVATTTIAAIWRHLTVDLSQAAAPTDAPLLLQIHDAVTLLNPADEAWRMAASRIAADRAAHPEDPHAAIVWAIHRAGLLLIAGAGDPAEPATYACVEDEIEGLVFASLPAIRYEPAFTIAAANLLTGVHGAHEDLAERLVREALEIAPAYAMAAPVIGQIAAKRGDLEGAVARFEEALSLCEPETEFEIFLLVLKMRTLIAANDRDAADAVFARIRRIKPITERQMGLMCLRPGGETMAPERRLALGRLTPEGARRLLGFQYFISARRYSVLEHQRNIMAGPLDHLVRRFGEAVVPAGVRAALGDS